MTRIMIYSGTAGFRHDSIAATVDAVSTLASEQGVDAFATEDAAIFSSTELSTFSSVVWAQSSGSGLLDSSQRESYERFTFMGGGFVGIHAASDGERDWPLFDQLIGARFRNHPSSVREAMLQTRRPNDASAAAFARNPAWIDEWYAFDAAPGPSTTLLMTVDESTYDVEAAGMGESHPIAWRTRVGAATAWYTALGHDAGAYADPRFRAHLWAGIASTLPSRTETDNV